MFIKSLSISYFKGFSTPNNILEFNIPDGVTKGSGLNIFLGENNTGKSTIFEALHFLRDETKDTNAIKNKLLDGTQPNHSSVEVVFCGDIEQVIENFAPDNKKSSFKKFIFETDKLKSVRNTENPTIISFWNESENKYDNPSGIGAPFKKLFDNNFIWADTNPSTEASFGASTMCGTLLKEIALSHTTTTEYQNFTQQFNNIFNNPLSTLRQTIQEVENKIKTVFSNQFGNADIRFHFDNLDITSYFKNAELMINDGIETAMTEKGQGMQKAIALALLQVYAETIAHDKEKNATKPFFIFIDEPEICLHPIGQKKLLEALLEISKDKQVFITTHSPYFLISPHLKNAGLFVFKNTNHSNSVKRMSNSNYLFPYSPSWGEINYKAYNIPTIELHNELYGTLQEKSGKFQEKQFEQWLVNPSFGNLSMSKNWTRENNGQPQSPYSVTLQTFIRNHIHHPENRTMQNDFYTYDELKQSIDEMIVILESLP